MMGPENKEEITKAIANKVVEIIYSFMCREGIEDRVQLAGNGENVDTTWRAVFNPNLDSAFLELSIKTKFISVLNNIYRELKADNNKMIRFNVLPDCPPYTTATATTSDGKISARVIYAGPMLTPDNDSVIDLSFDIV